eukprot:422685-Amphidinium_carterae.1
MGETDAAARQQPLPWSQSPSFWCSRSFTLTCTCRTFTLQYNQCTNKLVSKFILQGTMQPWGAEPASIASKWACSNCSRLLKRERLESQCGWTACRAPCKDSLSSVIGDPHSWNVSPAQGRAAGTACVHQIHPPIL